MVSLVRVPYSAIEIEDIGVVKVGDVVRFTDMATSSVKEGRIVKLTGTKSVKLTIVTSTSSCQEVWDFGDIEDFELLESFQA